MSFSIRYRQKRLLCVSFVEVQDFMIYQLVSKRTKILPVAISQIAHLCNQFNHVCIAILFHVLKAIFFFIKISSYFCKKMQNFRALKNAKSPKQLTLLRISCYAPVKDHGCQIIRQGIILVTILKAK